MTCGFSNAKILLGSGNIFNDLMSQIVTLFFGEVNLDYWQNMDTIFANSHLCCVFAGAMRDDNLRGDRKVSKTRSSRQSLAGDGGGRHRTGDEFVGSRPFSQRRRHARPQPRGKPCSRSELELNYLFILYGL